MSDIDVRKQALREIAKERAKKRGEVPSEPSLEEDKGRQQKETKEAQEGMPFKQASPKDTILERRREDDSAFSWTQFAPWKKQQKEKPKMLNTATIWCQAKRMIAREWREARGVKKKDLRLDQLEREATMWEEKQEEKKREQEEVKARFEKQKVKVEVALKIIGQKILEEKDNLTAKGAVALIEDAFGSIGKIYNIEWREDGCDIWIEPWEERWSRGKKDELPVIYNLKINDQLEVVSYDVVEDENLIVEQQEVLFERELQKGGPSDEEPLGADEEDIKEALEKKIAKVGRLIELQKMKEDIWLATVEPWGEMKIRNIERKGEGPIETESILAKVVDGAIVISPIKESKPWEKKVTEESPVKGGEETKPELGTAQQKEGGEDAS